MTRNRTALVTGAGGAVAGDVIARFHEQGWRTALVDVTTEPLTARAPASRAYAADLSDPVQARRVVEAAEADHDGLDAVVNIAGGFARVPAVEARLSDLQAQLTLNLFTAVCATTAALPGMLRRGGGTVLCLAAGPAVDGGAAVAPYAASKAALAAYFRSIDRELGGRGVRAVVVYPMGAIDTRANRTAMPDADPARWIDPVTLAAAIVQAVAMGPRGRLQELRVYPDA